MKIQHLAYLLSIIVFTGTAILIIWSRNKKLLKHYELVILAVSAASMPVALTEYFALKWQAWFYYPSQTLNIKFFAEVESYVFAAAIAALGATATIVYAAKVDRKTRPVGRTHKRR